MVAGGPNIDLAGRSSASAEVMGYHCACQEETITIMRKTLPRVTSLLAAVVILWGCASSGRVQQTSLELHSLRVPATVGQDATLDLSAFPPLVGHLALSPILSAEGLTLDTADGDMPLQVVIHYGRFYLAGDGFHSLWELTPLAGTDQASYRSIRVLADLQAPGMAGVKLSRFRNLEAVCIRLDQADHSPLFLSADGAFNATCQ